jgi:sialidase-1
MLKYFFLFLIWIFFFGCSTVKSGIVNKDPEETTLFFEGMDGVTNFRIPAITVTNKGTILAICDARVPKRGDIPNNIDCVIRRSEDHGKTWSVMKTILDYPGKQGVTDPSLLVDKETGTIYLFLNYGPEGIGLSTSQKGYGDNTIHVLMLKSTDDGHNWSEPVDITRSVKDSSWNWTISSPGHGIQLKNGTLVQPAYTSGNDNKSRSFFFYSKDKGNTWHRSQTIAERTGECMPLELPDGRIMMNMRNSYPQRRRAVSYTSDLGKTWSPLEFDEELMEPRCQASIIRLKNNVLGDDNSPVLFSNPADTSKRIKMTLRLSYDDAKSWKHSKVLFEGDASYSDLVFLHDGTIGILYEKGEDGYPAKRISFQKLNYDWIKK